MQEKIPDINFDYSRCTKGFKVMKLEEFFMQEEQINEIYKPHRLEFFQMIFISEGEGYHMVDFDSISLRKGSLIFTAPNQVQSFESKHSYDGYICFFSEQFLNREFLLITDKFIIDNLYFRDITKALFFEDKSLEVYFELFLKEYVYSILSGKESICVSLLNCILQKSKENFVDIPIDNKSSELFNSFKKILRTQYKDLHNAQEYALVLKVTPKHLNLICKKITGLTTKAFIDQFNIIEIKRYLASTTLPIKEISVNMGYWEVSNFVKFFKKHTGETPKAFRVLQSSSY